MRKDSGIKSTRILDIYIRLQQGKTLNKASLAQEFGVAERSIQRDIEDLRCFMQEKHLNQEILHSKQIGGYRMVDKSTLKFTNEEALATIKILLESRSMRKDEMFPILEKLLMNCIPMQHIPTIQRLIANEQLYYTEPHHGKHLLQKLWQLGEAVASQQCARIRYLRMKDTEPVTRTLEPVGLMFSEYYFYLIAYITDETIRNKLREENMDRYPAIYRIDRIDSIQVLSEHFRVPYLNRFQEGEFRKRVQFMYGGELQTVRFAYSGPSVEAVLDRFPTAEILEERDGVYTVQVEVFGRLGIEMWLRSQGKNVCGFFYEKRGL